MFQRRLLLLAVVAAATVGLFTIRLVSLTIVQGHENRLEAEQVLNTVRAIPTKRGPILDRHLRPLAEDRGSYNIAVRYPVIAGVWAYDRAESRARKQAGPAWHEWSFEQKIARIDQHLVRFDQQTEQLWQTLVEIGGIDRLVLEQRKNTIRRKLQRIASNYWMDRQRKRSLLLNEPVPLTDVVQPIRDQGEAQALLFDVSPEAATRVRGRIDAASQYPADSVWSQVEVNPPGHDATPRVLSPSCSIGAHCPHGYAGNSKTNTSARKET